MKWFTWCAFQWMSSIFFCVLFKCNGHRSNIRLDFHVTQSRSFLASHIAWPGKPLNSGRYYFCDKCTWRKCRKYKFNNHGNHFMYLGSYYLKSLVYCPVQVPLIIITNKVQNTLSKPRMILIEFQRRLSELKIKIVTLCKDDQAKSDFKSVSGGCLNSR